MEILFATSDMEAVAMSESALAKIFGASVRVACRRLCELAAMETLAVAASLPMHELTPQAEKSRYTVSVSPTHKIHFEAILNSGTATSTQGLNLSSVTAIRILSLGKL
jgi:hypothetical protein